MAEELREANEGGEKLNRSQRRHLFAGWSSKTPKLLDPKWRAKARAARKKHKKIVKQERRRNARLK